VYPPQSGVQADSSVAHHARADKAALSCVYELASMVSGGQRWPTFDVLATSWRPGHVLAGGSVGTVQYQMFSQLADLSTTRRRQGGSRGRGGAADVRGVLPQTCPQCLTQLHCQSFSWGWVGVDTSRETNCPSAP
jgi:hypothetical protein